MLGLRSLSRLQWLHVHVFRLPDIDLLQSKRNLPFPEQDLLDRLLPRWLLPVLRLGYAKLCRRLLHLSGPARLVLTRVFSAVFLSGAVVIAVAVYQASASAELTENRTESSCSRSVIASSVINFVSLLDQRRFSAVPRLWLPRPRFATPGFFRVASRGSVFKTRSARELPNITRRWLLRGPPDVWAVVVDARPSTSEPARSGYSLFWIRRGDGSPATLQGVAKGVWDCELQRLAMFVGGEQRFATEKAALANVINRCGRRGWIALEGGGRVVRLCRAPRG